MARKKLTAALPPTLPTNGFATVAQACAFLALSRAKVYAMMDANELAYARFGSARRIPWADLHRLADAATVAAS
jgi:excisionase family DNA binding protein